ncbi:MULTISPECIES: MFS transporter [unclassified Lysobacter]|uniref:MFS transporter n=1 Tax=unclassified Lysobacter TaxID=2635362 RepID=UPI001BEB84E7|nr:MULTISPECIES: MFS transporter [unclassified Lysobacter]MBT2748730.1 MFS transporter [Lysobacter sp. ISL-42]MBT2751665.1 MFS transporter [Lysobacter sp. ISL-50]MBT2775859.1 MFS transporter [Lysobacter sp. ISL-54]MBT2782177.1 MFS transporter [Lysobacter sp. ISL-52]
MSASRISRRVWSIGLVTGMGGMLVMLDATLAALALIAVQADLNAPVEDAQWVVSSYLISMAVSLPASAWFGNRFGHGRIWSVALVAFVAASIGCAFAASLGALIAARIAQGLAAGIMLPTGHAILVGVAERDQLGRVLGVVGTLISLAAAIGPGIGGWLVDVASWRWLFWINVPLGAAAVVWAARVMPRGVAQFGLGLPMGQLFLIVTGLPLALYGASEITSRYPAGNGWLYIGAGATLLALFIAVARTSKSSLLALDLMRNRQFRASSLLAVGNSANLFGGLVLFPLYFHAKHMSPTQIGVMLVFMGAGTTSALYLAGNFVDRCGPRPVVLAGAAMLAVSAAPFALVPVPSDIAAVFMFVRGIGLAWTTNPTTTAAYAAVDRKDIGGAATLVNTVQRVSGALGAVAVVASIGWLDGGEGRGEVRAMAIMVVLPVLQAWWGTYLTGYRAMREPG